MPTICVCVEPLFGDNSLVEKAANVTAAGFRAIEFWFYDAPEDRNLEALATQCRDTGLAVNDMVVNSPDGAIGGSLVSVADKPQYLARLRETIAVARKLDCKKLITCSGNTLSDVPRERQHQAIVETLTEAAAIASQEGMTLLLEPLNSLVEHPGYYLDSGHEAAEIVREVGNPHLRLLWDIYHMQIMHGNVLDNIAQYIDIIGHFHAAGVPGRHELDTGELNYPAILSSIATASYEGAFGLEYWPAEADHATSLARMRQYTTAAAGWV